MHSKQNIQTALHNGPYLFQTFEFNITDVKYAFFIETKIKENIK